MNTKVKAIGHAINIRRVQKDIRKWRLKLPTTLYVGVAIGVVAALYGLSMFLNLPLWAYILVSIHTILLLPSIFKAMYKSKYEKKKFLEVSDYMEQMLYSFKRTPKVLDALRDVLRLYPNSELGDSICDAIAYIEQGYAEKDLYKEALQLVEKTHYCRQLESVHNFLAGVEFAGGDHIAPADNLLLDRNAWVQRTSDSNTKLQNLKMNMGMSTLMAVGVLGVTVIMNKVGDLGTADNLIAQIITTICLITDITMWYVLVKKLDGSWINKAERYTKAEFDKYLDLVENPKQIKAGVVIAQLLIGGSLAFALHLVLQQLIITIAIAGFTLFVIANPIMKNRMAEKTIQREVANAFAEWMMQLALNMQTETVGVALRSTLKTAPYVIQLELRKMIATLDENPMGMDAYMNFYSHLGNTDISTSMRSLYSMSQYGTNDMQRQIYGMLERNAELQDKAAKSRAETEQAAYNFILYIPILVGAIKLLSDMVFTMSGIMASANGVM